MAWKSVQSSSKTGTPFGKTSKCIILIEKAHLVTGMVSLDIEFEYSHLPA